MVLDERAEAAGLDRSSRPSRKTATIRTNGAAQFSNRRTASMPRRMIAMLSAQKIAKLSHRVHGWAGSPRPIGIRAGR